MSRHIAALAAVSLLASTAVLAEESDRHAQFGIGVSTNRYEVDVLGGSRRATGADFFLNYQASRFVSAEASYLYGGSLSEDVLGARVTLRTNAYGVSILPTLPLGESFALFGRVGFFHANGRIEATANGRFAGDNVEDESVLYGAGLRASLDGAHVRLEYNRASFGDVDTNRVSLSVAWFLW